MTDRLTIIKPDDWHLHLRDGAMLRAVLPDTVRHFARAIVMPNLNPPIVTTADATAYRQRIEAAIPKGHHFTPLMTAYLTEQTDPKDIAKGFGEGVLTAVKLYPAGATTNSASGVQVIDRVLPVLERMAALGMTLCVHGEVVDSTVDIFDREQVFIDTVLDPLRRRLPELRVVLEHITTAEAVEYVRGASSNLAASITTHHLMINRNALLAGGIRPHFYCLPVAKREAHRLALRSAATSGDGRFFLGTDSAPHSDSAKLQACGCAGIYTAPVALPCLAHIFEAEGRLDRLEAFTSINGAKFYRLPINEARVNLIRRDTPAQYPKQITAGDEVVTVFDTGVFDAGIDLFWHIEEE